MTSSPWRLDSLLLMSFLEYFICSLMALLFQIINPLSSISRARTWSCSSTPVTQSEWSSRPGELLTCRQVETLVVDLFISHPHASSPQLFISPADVKARLLLNKTTVCVSNQRLLAALTHPVIGADRDRMWRLGKMIRAKQKLSRQTDFILG